MNRNGCGGSRMARLPHLFLGILILLVAGGCGSGGSVTVAGVGTGGTGSTASLSGKVADGYLAGARVFLDKNGNYQLDAGEPSTTSDADGAFMLTVDQADVGLYPIVALVSKGVTIDKDTNVPVPNSYVLSMPAGSVSSMAATNFVSPFSTQLREMMETGLYATTRDAAEALRIKMGLAPGMSPLSDYLSMNSTSMHDGARNMATLMGDQMGLVFLSGTSTLDVNRYRAMMSLLYANMTTIMNATQADMTNLNNMMTTTLSAMSPMGSGQMFQNMSSAYRGRMGGMN